MTTGWAVTDFFRLDSIRVIIATGIIHARRARSAPARAGENKMNSNRFLRMALIVLASSAFILACDLNQFVAQSVPTVVPTDTAVFTATRTSLPPTATPSVTPTPIPIRVYATAKADLSVFATPATSAKVVARLVKGNALQVVGRTSASDWLQVELATNANQRGWIRADSTSLNVPVTAIPIVNALGTPQAPTATVTPKVLPSPTIQSKPSFTPIPSLTRPPGPPQPSTTPQPFPFGTRAL